MRALWLAAVVGAALGLAPAAAHADDVTPDGPATLTQGGGCGVPAIGLAGQMLTGFSITVGAGSRADRVRVRNYRGPLSDWFDLPATAGTYAVPASPQPWYDPYDTGLSLDQQSGGLAVLRPATAEAPSCEPVALQVRGGDPPPGWQAPITASIPDRRLALRAVTARDDDGDLVPDDQERTDMALALGATPARGTTQVVARIVNRGPNAVSGVRLTLSAPPAAGLVPPAALSCSVSPFGAAPGALPCTLRGPIGPGASIDLPIAVGVPQEAFSVTGTLAPVTNDPDLDPSNDSATVAVLPAAPTLTLLGPTRARIGDPIRLRLRSDRAGTFALRGAVALPGGRTLALPARTVALAKDVRRVVTVRPSARQARSLRRARGVLPASFTLTGDAATPPALVVRLRR